MKVSSFSVNLPPPLPYTILRAPVDVQLLVGVSIYFLATAGILGALGMCWLGHVYVHTHGHTHMAVTVSQSASVACTLEAGWRLGPLLLLVSMVPWMSFSAGPSFHCQIYEQGCLRGCLHVTAIVLPVSKVLSLYPPSHPPLLWLPAWLFLCPALPGFTSPLTPLPYQVLCASVVSPHPFQTSVPIVKAPLSQHPSFLCLPFGHTWLQREAGR